MLEAKPSFSAPVEAEDPLADARQLLYRLDILTSRLDSVREQLDEVRIVYDELAAVQARLERHGRLEPARSIEQPPLAWRLFRAVELVCRRLIWNLRQLFQGPNWHL
jgi:hypothetical protein